MSDPTAASGTGLPAPRLRHQRKLSNYLLDKSLQLRYVLLVSLLSAGIAGALGYMIYDQRRTASESIEHDLQALTRADASHQEFQQQISSDLASDDAALVYKMIAVGIGLVVILSAYLIIMTHKVAGPLHKVSMYFDHMAAGRLGNVTPLRHGDMLQDFFSDFKETHEALRAQATEDAAAMDRAASVLRAAEATDRAALDTALAALEQHVQKRKQRLA